LSFTYFAKTFRPFIAIRLAVYPSKSYTSSSQAGPRSSYRTLRLWNLQHIEFSGLHYLSYIINPMAPGILSSNLITVDSLNVLLNSVAAQDPTYKFQLLSTKLAILTNRPSQPVQRSYDSELQILQCRLDIARAAFELTVPKLVLAEEELRMVERDCKGIIKRICRRERARSDKAATKSGDGGAVKKDETAESKENLETGAVTGTGVSASTPERPAPTPLPTSSTSTSTSTDTTATTISNTSSMSTGTLSKYQARQRTITALRVEALKLLGEVEEMQGRPERRGRWDSLALRLEE